ncbi:MAG: LytTR family DNA-binding domain-containing protein [Bacteroidota bacterium]|nr:LytTR family DNA-binding domain-containing protein [Bacteroidota bacterium]
MRVVAVDDEPLALALLEDNIRQIPSLRLLASCSSAMEALSVLREQEVDLIFLDIQMPGLTGLQFLQSLAKRPMIILITAYEKYALEGFNLDVIDYLVKPVPLERFLKACNKAQDFFRLRQNAFAAGEQEQDYFFVNAEYGLIKIVIPEILLIEGLKDYLKIHMADGKPLVIRMSLKSIEEKLPAHKFFRIHKSYIVSLSRITSIRKNSVFLGSQKLPLSDHYKDDLLRMVDPGNR